MLNRSIEKLLDKTPRVYEVLDESSLIAIIGFSELPLFALPYFSCDR